MFSRSTQAFEKINSIEKSSAIMEMFRRMLARAVLMGVRVSAVAQVRSHRVSLSHVINPDFNYSQSYLLLDKSACEEEETSSSSHHRQALKIDH